MRLLSEHVSIEFAKQDVYRYVYMCVHVRSDGLKS